MLSKHNGSEKNLESLAKDIYDYAVSIAMPIGKNGWNHPQKGEGSQTSYYSKGELHFDGLAETDLKYFDQLREKFPQIKSIELSGYDNGLNVIIRLKPQK